MNNRYTLIASAYLFFIEKDAILLSRRFNTGYEDGKYSVPAGHLEKNETIRHAAKREAKEEVGVIIQSEDLFLVHIMHRKQEDERLDFFFLPKRWTGTLTNQETDKCDQLIWTKITNLPENTIPYISSAIQMYQRNVLYSEFGWV